MQRLDRLARDSEALVEAEPRESIWIIGTGPTGDIGADDDASWLIETSGGIKDALILAVGPGDAPID